MSPEDLRWAELECPWRPSGRGAPVNTADGPGVVVGYDQRWSGRGACWEAVVRLLDGRVRHYGINSMSPRERGAGEAEKMREFEREARERRAAHDGALDAAEVGRAIVRGAGRADVPLAALASTHGSSVRRAVDDLLSGRMGSADDVERYVAAACRAAVLGYAQDVRKRRRAAALGLRASDAGAAAAAALTPEDLDRVDAAACAAEIDGRRRWAEAERDAWRRKAEALEAECAAMREAVEGRAEPPTPEERAALAAEGGSWVATFRGALRGGAGPDIEVLTTSFEWDSWERETPPAGARYWAKARDGRPRAFPKVPRG